MENTNSKINDPIQQAGNPHENMRQDVAKAKKLVSDEIKKAYPKMEQNKADDVATQMLKNNNGSVKVGDVEVRVSDFSMIVAKSIQSINSETSPLEEFYRWIDDAKDVIHEMNDNQITEADLKHREDFLGDLDQREVEIKTCIALYQNAATFGSGKVREQAQQQLEFLRRKWAKLLELRSAVKSSTKNRLEAQLEPETTEDEYSKSKLYEMALCYMRKGLEVPARIKMKLGLMSAIVFDRTLADEMVKTMKEQPKSKAEVIERINILRGRQDPSYRPKSVLERQNFSPEYFQSLEQRSMDRR